MNDNKIIAEFMGMKPHHQDSGCLIRVDDNGSNEVVPIEQLPYHTSWDWLMPCIKKIDGYANEKMCFEEYDDYRTQWAMIDKPSKYPIDNVYKQVVEFIKWYNGLEN